MAGTASVLGSSHNAVDSVERLTTRCRHRETNNVLAHDQTGDHGQQQPGTEHPVAEEREVQQRHGEPAAHEAPIQTDIAVACRRWSVDMVWINDIVDGMIVAPSSARVAMIMPGEDEYAARPDATAKPAHPVSGACGANQQGWDLPGACEGES